MKTKQSKVSRRLKKPPLQRKDREPILFFILLVSLLIFILAARYFLINTSIDNRQTLTFGEIGRYGRLGNQLFQVASTIGIAQTNKLNYTFPHRIEESTIGGMFDIKGSIPDERLDNIPVIHEVKEEFYDVKISSESPLISLHGYFQSYQYFFLHNHELKKVMKFGPSILKNVRAACPEINLPNTLGIHIRRTDYLNYPDLYRVLGSHYYDEALVLLHNNAVPLDAIIIASDDITAAKILLRSTRNLQLFNVPIVFSPFSEAVNDFALLSMCKHLVIANSSFSWWAAYLNMLQFHNGSVIAPSPWYKTDGGLSHLNRPDFYLPHWQVISTAD
jgi:galactoside 2-L-fucosyltransferase 1/2